MRRYTLTSRQDPWNGSICLNLQDEFPGMAIMIDRQRSATFRVGLSWERVLFVQVASLIVVGAAIWGYFDIAGRGAVVPGHLDWHRTDFSVYTTAGAAFFDGRDPYAVKNPRGWSYLYPPLFALMVAPLSGFDPMNQTLVWFSLNIAACFLIYFESLWLWRSLRPALKTGERPIALWVAACTALSALLPTLECLQRGQVGIVLLYALLVGFRLVREGKGPGTVFLGGLVLAWPISVKLIPVLPVGFLVWQVGSQAVFSGGSRREIRQTGSLGLGLLTGGVLFLLIVPAACLGWNENLRHLTTWTRKVVTNPDAGNEARFHIDSVSNQSLANASYWLAATFRGKPPQPSPVLLARARNEGEVRWLQDRAIAERRKADTTTRRIVQGIQVLMAFLLLVLATVPDRGDPIGQAVGFGLACVGTLLFSPIAWSHYFMIMLPAVLAFPLWLDVRGHSVAARVSAAAPALLVWTHYLAKGLVGPVGLLGLGISAWFLVASAALLSDRLRWVSHTRTYRPRFAGSLRAGEPQRV